MRFKSLLPFWGLGLLLVLMMLGNSATAQKNGYSYRPPPPQQPYRAPANQNRPQFQQQPQYNRTFRTQQLGQLRTELTNQKTQQLNVAKNQGTIQQGSNKPSGMVLQNSMPKMNRVLTPSEMQRGFTGRTTADGRALIKFNNQIFAVPASRISGLSAKLAAQKNQQRASQWTTQQQAAISQRVKVLTGGGGRGGGSSPPPGTSVKAANDNLEPEFLSARHKLQYNNAKTAAQTSQKPVLILGRYPNYLSAAFFGRSDSFYMSPPDWRRAEAEFRRSNSKSTDEDVRNHMFETYNKKYIDDFLSKKGRVVLASPYSDMKGKPSYSQMEIKHLESLGYVLSPDETEMIKK